MNAFDSLTIEPRGCHLIEASAGTGKTYAIASLYVRLVIENEQCKPENILVVTFTEAATKELRDRIRKRLHEARDVAGGLATGDPFLLGLMNSSHPGWPGGETARARLDLALQTFDCAAISTIHGFCGRALQENAFESGSLFDTELVTNQKPLLRQIVDDFWRTRFFGADAPLLPLARAKKWSPDSFSAFLRGKLTNPMLKIVPEFTPAEIIALDSNCRVLYEEVCRIWLDSNEEIKLILSCNDGLSINQKHYRSDAIPELIAGMDCFASHGSPYAFFTGSAKLTSRYMNTHRLKKYDPPEHPFFTAWDELVDHVDTMAVAVHGELIAYAKKQLPERKAALNVRFFDDLMTDLHRALVGSSGAVLAERMRAKYRAALIDEFQDTDQIQYEIFRSVFRDGSIPLFLIGDPKQAIYSFRGADIYAYLEAKADVPDDRHHTMTLNWRSSEKLVEAIGRLFEGNKKYPLVIEGLDFPEVKVPENGDDKQNDLTVGERDTSPLQLWFFNRGPTEKVCIPKTRALPLIVAAVTEEIVGLLADASEGNVTLGGKAVVPGDIAVIVRGHAQAKQMYESLQSRGIPAVVRSDQSIFMTREARELRTVLAAVAEPGHEAKVRASLATRVLGMSANEIARTMAADGETEWETRLATFREYHDLWKNYGFMTMFRALLEREGARGRLLSRPGGERSVTNLLQCGELLHAEASASHLGVDALCTWFSEQVAAPPEGDEHQIRLESDEKAVKILTIHVSKGLEFPIVFCPFLWGGVIDSGDTVIAHEGFELVADFGSDAFDQHHKAAMNEGLAENIRLLYVALTRAKYRCYLAWGRFRHAESSAIAYLLHASETDDASSAYEGLKNVMGSMEDSAMIEKLREIASEGLIHLTLDPHEECTADILRTVDAAGKYQCRTMARDIENDWKVTSFSSLVDRHGAHPELPDYDSSDEPHTGGGEGSSPEGTIFSFPKGASAGTFLHTVFEHVDFASDSPVQLKDLVSRLLAKSTYDATYTDVVSKMLTAVLSAELSEGLSLSALQPGSWVQEMEFYFPLRSLEPQQFVSVFKKFGITSPVDFERVARQLNFQRVKGMLLGFIDLVFTHGGKYYIIDWKSNHLGHQPENYHPGNLAREMERKLYPLQYLLYTVAVNRYLERRIVDYHYDSHFGGVFYLFLRGIDAAYPGNGIYFDKPPAALVAGLTKCLIDIEEV